MKIIKIIALTLLIASASDLNAQTKKYSNSYGKTLNLGLGVGYYGYIGHSTPVLHANYEIDVAKNFTLAPFITVYSYERHHYWGNSKYEYRNYSYRQTVVPIGVKGSYYFDDLLDASENWDFYLGASLGVAIVNTTWESDYYGDEKIHHGPGRLYLDAHIGTEYHINQKVGLYLDLSSGISTVGLALHL